MKISGIYSITNTINNKIYYGSSNDCEHRWNQHKSLLNKNKHKNLHLQNSWNLYGLPSFKFDIIKETKDNQLQEIEHNKLFPKKR
jgi:group I intron endonuclease